MRYPTLLVVLLLPFGPANADPTVTFHKTPAALWGIAETDQAVVAVGPGGALAIKPNGHAWAARKMTPKRLMLALAARGDGTIVMVGGRGGFTQGGSLIAISRDQGKTWDEAAGLRGATLYDIKFISEDLGYAGGALGTLLQTQDGGESWQPLATGLQSPIWAIHFFDAMTGLIGAGFTPWQNDNLSSGKIMRTEDGGKTWGLVHQGKARISDFSFVTPDVGYAAGVGGTLLKTSDGGRSWTPGGKVPLKAIVNAIEFETPSCGLAIGNGGRAYVTQDGGQTWPLAIEVTTRTFLEDLSPARTGGYWVAAGNGVVARIDLGDICTVPK